ncbi:ribonuclease H-like domain-containing protein [Mycena galericulata]|nr:ribonuclease H-like domain-containing protein [Mycena galericulata]
MGRGQTFVDGECPWDLVQVHELIPSAVACQYVGSTRGDKKAWIPHILRGKGIAACSYASPAAIAEATAERDEDVIAKQTGTIAAVSAPAPASRKHHRASSGSKAVEGESSSKRLRQTTLQAFNGQDMPFSSAQIQAIEAQTLRATVSTGIPFRVWENREMKELLGMLRTAAPDIMPSRKVVSGRLLNEAAAKVEDGASVNAVCAVINGKVRLVCQVYRWNTKSPKAYVLELIDATEFNKDGPALCAHFDEIIERVQKKYGCSVIIFITDADGGSKKGRILLGKKRPYLLVPSCWAHQFQLILGDYFKVFPHASDVAERATGLIGWINNHGKVRKIFDNVQAQLSQERVNKIIILAYLVASMTRWTTHFVAFMRLLVLRKYLQFAVMQNRGKIISAQVGAAKSTEKQRLEDEAIFYCNLIGDNDHTFWSGLTSVVEDLEPICYGTNINQADSTRPGQVLLTLVGLYLHYDDHPEPAVSTALIKRIEKRWADCDQPLYLVALILNPFEGLSCFGPRADFSHFKATSLVVNVYRRMMDYPENEDSADVRMQKERQMSSTLFEYFSSTKGFAGFQEYREEFEATMGKDPIAVWTALQTSGGLAELARFAIMVLTVVVNQAACERVFSEVKNNESPHRARIGLEKLEKMSKEEHLKDGVVLTRKKRKNHASVEKLLAVPRYRDLLEDSDDENVSGRGPALVSSSPRWRAELSKWILSVQEADEDSNSDSADDEASQADTQPPKARGWVKKSLAVLFGGPEAKAKLTIRISKREIDAEAELMEALADAEEEEQPDDGAIDRRA